MAGGLMSQVTGMIPGMKKEEEVPDVAPQEEQYQEYTVSTSKPWSIFMSRRIELLKVSCSRNLQLSEYFIELIGKLFNTSMTPS